MEYSSGVLLGVILIAANSPGALTEPHTAKRRRTPGPTDSRRFVATDTHRRGLDLCRCHWSRSRGVHQRTATGRRATWCHDNDERHRDCFDGQVRCMAVLLTLYALARRSNVSGSHGDRWVSASTGFSAGGGSEHGGVQHRTRHVSALGTERWPADERRTAASFSPDASTLQVHARARYQCVPGSDIQFSVEPRRLQRHREQRRSVVGDS